MRSAWDCRWMLVGPALFLAAYVSHGQGTASSTLSSGLHPPPETAATVQVDDHFPAGNVTLVGVSADTVYFTSDLRDTSGDWFYWNFRAISSAPQTWFFKATKGSLLTTMGAAYSLDGGDTWKWIDRKDHHSESLFSFTFEQADQAVRFSMGMPYTERHLFRFLNDFSADSRIRVDELCVSEGGRTVEKIVVQTAESQPRYKVLVTARAHACEMMGNYVMEGMLAALLSDNPRMKALAEQVSFWFIPFLDKDGVEEGDQGKNRIPRDHNRDYSGESIYASTRSLRQQVPEWVGEVPWVGIDLHNPWIKGENNEWIYFVGNANPAISKEQERLVDMLAATYRGPMKFTRKEGFMPFGVAWNTGANYDQGASFGQWAAGFQGKGLKMATTLEFPYALNHGQVVTAEGARAFGADLMYALQEYLGAEAP
ncbi:M14 family zinc carboxypeptidase [Lunatimonas salinarum]|uniref:M14 family zinc carboxypeptidase n=1 Tax=Lunatimonas salinarum TaxID=1774590 RepID=UPI001FD80446|nr:M14 family zinc carboxypeptidase [Lunatimonas salinarum]